MDMENILAALRAERDRVDAALAALDGIKGRGSRTIAAGFYKRKTRTLSAAARKKISDAAKARWAKAKRAGRNSL